jgi:O-antigen ligase
MTNEGLKPKLISIANIDLLLFVAFIVSFFMHYRVNGFIAMLLIIFGFVKLFMKKLTFRGGWGLLFLPGLFLTLIIGQLYTTDLKEGWTLVERNISLLLLPFAISSVREFSPQRMKELTYAIIVSTVGFGLLFLVNAGIESYAAESIYTIPNDTHFLYNRFMHHNLTSPFDIHAVYYALWVALANCIVFKALIQQHLARNKRILLGLTFLFLMVLLYLLKSANITFGYAICCLIIIAYQYGKSIFNSRKKTGFLIVGVLVLGLFTYQGISSKLDNFKLSYDMSDQAMGPLGIRLSIWDCTWQVIQENLVLGTGTGDSHHELLKKYYLNDFVIGYENDFDSHNMYLQYWMSNGLLALGLFVFGLIVLFKKAVQHKNVIFLSFVLLFALFSLTESTMRTQKGMLFFVFFAALFYWAPKFLSHPATDK